MIQKHVRSLAYLIIFALDWVVTLPDSLTLALMGSDDLNLRVLSTSSDDPKERKSAEKVLRLLQRGRHWVLVVLLLGNVVSL